MTFNRSAARLAALALAAAVVALGLGLIFRGEYLTGQTATRTFTLPEDFTKVRKILVRTDGAKQIITMGGDSEFVDQKWSGIGVDVEPGKVLEMMFDPEFHLELFGELTVRSRDEYIGQPLVKLKQHVTIEVDFLNSAVNLAEPTERLRGYRMTTRFERAPNDAGSRITLELTQQILTDAPWFAHGIADRRVRASAERALENQERAIRQLIAANRDNVPLLPLR